MAIVYTQDIDGNFAVTTYDPDPDFEGAVIPNDIENRDRATMQAQLNAFEATLVAYAGSPEELADAITVKVLDLGAEFKTRTGFGFAEGFALSQVFEVQATPNGVDFTTNLNAYAAAVVVIAGLVSVAAANAYDVVTTPSWAA